MSHIERAGGGVASERTTTPSDPQRPTAPGAGHVMRAEIHQQPSRWAAFLREAAGSLTEARSLLDSRPRFVLFVARGTSDNAALYGSYLVQTTLGLPTGSACPSATTLTGPGPTWMVSSWWRSASPASHRISSPSRRWPGPVVPSSSPSPMSATRRSPKRRTPAWTSWPGRSGPSRRPRPTPASSWPFWPCSEHPMGVAVSRHSRRPPRRCCPGRRRRSGASRRGTVRHAGRRGGPGLLLRLRPGVGPQARRDRPPVRARLQRCRPVARADGDARRAGSAPVVHLGWSGCRADA